VTASGDASLDRVYDPCERAQRRLRGRSDAVLRTFLATAINPSFTIRDPPVARRPFRLSLGLMGSSAVAAQTSFADSVDFSAGSVECDCHLDGHRRGADQAEAPIGAVRLPAPSTNGRGPFRLDDTLGRIAAAERSPLTFSAAGTFQLSTPAAHSECDDDQPRSDKHDQRFAGAFTKTTSGTLTLVSGTVSDDRSKRHSNMNTGSPQRRSVGPTLRFRTPIRRT